MDALLTGRKTLTRHTIEQEHRHRDASGDFSGLLNAIATAVKIIANQVNKGALVGALDRMDVGNVQGEVRKRLDAVSHEVMVGETEWGGHLAALASGDMPEPRPVPAGYRRGKYLLVFDPLDGSGGIDVNIPVGTVFSVLRSPDPGAEPSVDDFLQPGVEQVCAGFALYGPATMLVLTTGDGVDGFTLDRDIGAFLLTHPRLRIPERTSEFAIDAANERFWEPPVKRYVAECLAGTTGPRGRDFTMRWVASLAAEAYRILTRGGVFLSPADTKDPADPGRLRLMYACNPVAFLVEQAGGFASTGRSRMLDVRPAGLDQRAPLVFGSLEEVERIELYHREPVRSVDADFSLFNVRSLFKV